MLPEKLFRLCPLLVVIALIILVPEKGVRAQEGEIVWSEPFKISGSEDEPASHPYLLADPSGVAHLFWSHRRTIEQGEPNTVMYASWENGRWSRPVDIFLTVAPELPGIAYPTAVLDQEGIIHLVWLDQNWPSYAIYYSSAPAEQAGNAQAWREPTVLAADATGTNYSIDLAYEAADTLHVVFARVEQGDDPPEQRAVAYIRSSDRGRTWSDPVDIYTVADMGSGASNVRVLTGGGQKVFASWSVWDETGNGRAVLFARSLSGGDMWERPVVLDEKKEGEYERDWNNLVLLGEDRLMAMWEGGYRAYPQAQYSYDAGATWSEPIDTFPGLIGENGYAEFAWDGAGRLHVFLAQRIREGNPSNLIGGRGLWHSVYQGDTRWGRPTMIQEPRPTLYPVVAVINGNQVVASWYTIAERAVMVVTGEIVNSPAVGSQPWPTATPQMTPSPSPAIEETALAATPVQLGPSSSAPPPQTMSPGSALLIGILPSLATILLVAAVSVWRFRS